MFSRESWTEPQLASARFGTKAGFALIGALAGLMLAPTTATAQATDEVWILPAFYVPNGKSEPLPCRFFKEKEDRTSTVMDELQAIHQWPTTNQRLTHFSFLQNLMIDDAFCESVDPDYTFFKNDTSDDAAELTAWTNGDRDGDGTFESDPLGVGVISRTFFLDSPSVPTTDPDYQTELDASDLCDAGAAPGFFGKEEAAKAFPLYKRWLANDGRIDYVQVDFPIWRSYEDIRRAFNAGADCPDTGGTRQSLYEVWPIHRLASEIAAFLEEMQSKVTGALGTDPGDLTAAQVANYDPDVLLWTAVGLELSDPDSDADPIANGESLEYLLECVRLYIEGGTGSVCQPGTTVTGVTGSPKFEGVSIDADPSYVERQGLLAGLGVDSWLFDRLITMQEVVRGLGLEVSISNHMGPCGQGKKNPGDVLRTACKNDSATTATNFNHWARTTFLRYADEFVDAGGRPDHLMLNHWLYYPESWGNEFDDPTGSGYTSLSEITKEVLTETYPRQVPIDYLTDDFSDESNWVDHNGCFTATTSGSVKVLRDDDTANGSSGRCLATLKTDATAAEEQMVDFDLTFNLKWTAGSDWAGVTFRKTSALDQPWQSGYLVYVNATSVGLSRKNKSWPAVTLDGNPTLGDGVELTVVARGDWIRVYEGTNEIPLINIVDAGHTETGKLMGLATLNAEADFGEPLTLTRVDRQAFGDFFEGYDTTSLDLPWVDIDGFTVSASDPQDQVLVSSDSEFSSATVDGFSAADARISARISPQQDGRWGAVQIRKTTNGALPWATGSGYSAMLINSGGSGLLRLYCKDCPSSHLPSPEAGNYVATETLGSISTDGHIVDLVAIGDRIQVYVDGQLEIDHWETDSSRPTSGTVGVAAAQDLNVLHPDTALDDVFVMEPLP